MVAILRREWMTSADLAVPHRPRGATNSKASFNKFEHGLAGS
jgi:hypothetical protein